MYFILHIIYYILYIRYYILYVIYVIYIIYYMFFIRYYIYIILYILCILYIYYICRPSKCHPTCLSTSEYKRRVQADMFILQGVSCLYNDYIKNKYMYITLFSAICIGLQNMSQICTGNVPKSRRIGPGSENRSMQTLGDAIQNLGILFAGNLGMRKITWAQILDYTGVLMQLGLWFTRTVLQLAYNAL